MRLDSTEVARVISEATHYEHADTFRGDPNDFHTEAVSLEPDAPVVVRGTEGTTVLDDIAGVLLAAGYAVEDAEGPYDEDYGTKRLLVTVR